MTLLVCECGSPKFAIYVGSMWDTAGVDDIKEIICTNCGADIQEQEGGKYE